MGTAMDDVLGRLRRPEYTGENRCLPCTAVNAAIATVVAVVVGLSAPLDALGATVAAGTVLAVAAAAIYLRGYLVPGTPWFTRTYLPDRVLRYFDHGPAGPAGSPAFDPAGVLADADAVTECEDVDDLCLTDGFRAAWHERIDALRDTDASRDDLAAMLDLPRGAIELQDRGAAFVAVADAEAVDNPSSVGAVRVGQWESEGAFVADMAAAGVLAERLAGWEAIPPVDRGRVLNGLRVFLEACPTCGGDVEFGEETVESCCRSREVVAVTCTACGDRLFEAEQPVG